MVLTAIPCWGITDYNILQGKAERFFEHEEWPSASAMYELMLAQRPKEIPVYCNAIVAAGMMKNVQMQASLLERCENQAIPFDSLFSGIRKVAISLGQPDIYVDFMTMMKKKQPWLTRTIDIRLLDFYAFRSDADNMINTATILLKATPENIQFIGIMGEGYSLKGDYDQSMACYRKILQYDPTNIKALLILGNYYNMLVSNKLQSVNLNMKKLDIKDPKVTFLVPPEIQEYIHENSVLALGYLEKAATIKNTPYLDKTCARLKSLLKKIQ